MLNRLRGHMDDTQKQPWCKETTTLAWQKSVPLVEVMVMLNCLRAGIVDDLLNLLPTQSEEARPCRIVSWQDAYKGTTNT